MSARLPGLSMIRAMVTCRWTARRIQRYLDADPSALLSGVEVARLEAHLSECERCSKLTQEHRMMRGAFGRWAAATPPDPDAVRRLRVLVDTLGSTDAT
ncbi:MAG: zf-HC2 domain-containing protein [Ornithinimicrobium sp.]